MTSPSASQRPLDGFALILGASSGFGEAAALALAAAGRREPPPAAFPKHPLSQFFNYSLNLTK